MYTTAHRVEAPSGKKGINAFYHEHGGSFLWPSEPWKLPETEPGQIMRRHTELSPGGNHVASYLDIIAPDDVPEGLVEAALDAMWLELAAEESEQSSLVETIPNPVIYRHRVVVLRFGVESESEISRAQILTELRKYATSLIRSEG